MPTAIIAGRTVYSLNPETGLVQEQRQTWGISALEALRETFTPSFGLRREV
jgi:hypothetical protein